VQAARDLPGEAPRVSSVMWVRRVVAFCVLVTLVVALPVGYYRVGWTRMEAACGADRPGDPKWTSVEYGWSWSPAGFQCTYDTGMQRTSLWF
jgi:hypothetical protein